LKFGKKKAVVRLRLLSGEIPSELLKKEEKVEEEKKEKIKIEEVLEKVSCMKKDFNNSQENLKKFLKNLKKRAKNHQRLR